MKRKDYRKKLLKRSFFQKKAGGRILFLFFVSPSLVHASLGDDLNSLIDRFFGTEDRDKPLVEETKPEDLNVPPVVISSQASDEDLQRLQEEIFLEEAQLQQAEEAIRKAETTLQNVLDQKTQAQTHLALLDQEMTSVNTRLQQFIDQEQRWKKTLASLTKEKQDLEALIRIKQQAVERIMNKNSVQKKRLGGGSGVSLIHWLFSRKSVSQILEAQRLMNAEEKLQKQARQQLQSLKHALEAKQQQSALVLAHTSRVKQRVAEQKKLLHDLTRSKANLLSHLEFSQGKAQKAIENYRRQQAESTIYLQNLRQGLSEVREKLREPTPKDIPSDNPLERESSTSFFDFPLRISPQVTAFFRDKDFEKQFGRTHNGVDFWAPQGTDIFAPRAGTVKKVALNGLGYSYLILEHDRGFFTVYGHVSDIFVQEGQPVARKQAIAQTGGEAGEPGSGYFTSGPHLHFEVFQGGQFINPLTYLPPIQE